MSAPPAGPPSTAAAVAARTRRRALISDLALVLITVVWGTTFPLTKSLLAYLQPFSSCAVRYGLAAAVVVVLCGPRRLLRQDRRTWAAASLLGVTLFAGFTLQVFGLIWTTPTKSAFLTALSVPLVPFLGIWILRRTPPLSSWLGCALAFAGSALLTYQAGLFLGPGELCTLGTAAVFALEIVLVSRILPGRDALAVSAIICIVCAALGSILALATHEPAVHWAALPWRALLWLGIVANAGTLMVQNAAQKHTTAVRAAIIFALEPLWAALFAYLWQGDALSPRAWLGSAMILSGILVSELRP